MAVLVMATPMGNMRMVTEGEALTELRVTNEPLSGGENRVSRQLDEYFSGQRREFDIQIRPEGTEFQKRVWKEISAIPYGQTCSYGEIARTLGKPNAARAVGTACGKNPLWIVVPCHRVVGAKGLGGYAGGEENKKFLLELEQRKAEIL